MYRRVCRGQILWWDEDQRMYPSCAHWSQRFVIVSLQIGREHSFYVIELTLTDPQSLASIVCFLYKICFQFSYNSTVVVYVQGSWCAWEVLENTWILRGPSRPLKVFENTLVKILKSSWKVFEFCVLHMLWTLTVSFLYLSCVVFILLSCLFVMSFFAAFLLCICEWIFNKLLSLVTPRKKLYLFVMGFEGQKSRTR